MGDLGSFGSPNIRTTALDRMAEQGAKLTQFYTQPLCSPSRASLLTGRLPIRTGIYTNESYPLDEVFRVFYPVSSGCLPSTEVTLPELLHQAGYYSALIGKWHLGSDAARNCSPIHHGFQYFFGMLYSHEEGYPGPPPEGWLFPPVPLTENDRIVEQPPDLTTLTTRYTQRALQILAASSSSSNNHSVPIPNPRPLGPLAPAPAAGQPWALFVHYEESHVPLFTAPGYANVSDRGLYGSMTEQLDGSIAVIVDQLVRLGLADNTMVLFTADNGAWIDPSSGFPGAPGQPATGGSNAPYRDGKGSTWQGGMLNPAILWWPQRIPPGQRITQPTTIMDVFPTFCEVAGIPLPGGVTMDGRSMWSLINGSVAQPYSIADVAAQARQRLQLPNSSSLEPTLSSSSSGLTPLHDAVFLWRERDLYAVVRGGYKAHFITRPGFVAPGQSGAPVYHDPPLLFDLSWDYGESTPLNVTVAPYDAILADLVAVAQAHNASVTRATSQYDMLDFSAAPCCNKPYNESEALEYAERGLIGLALFDSCVCNPENVQSP